MKKFNITDLSNLSEEEIFESLIMRFVGMQNTTCIQYYCGITNDPERRLGEHERVDWPIDEILAVIDCGNQEKAACVEGLMKEKGFDTGDTDVPGNGGKDDSTFVYLVKKGKRMVLFRPKPTID